MKAEPADVSGSPKSTMLAKLTAPIQNTGCLVAIITFLAVFAMAARISVDSDTWWHLRAGEWIIQNRAIPQVDYFSYTRLGEPWRYPGWLVEVPMYFINEAFGSGGLNLWTATLITLTFIFVWQTLSGGFFLRAFVIILAAAASAVYWAARPYLITFLFAAIFLWVLEDFRWQRANRLWLLPILMVIWANSHGGFAVGFMLWVVYWIVSLFHTSSLIFAGGIQAKLFGSRRPTPVVYRSAARPSHARLLTLTWIGLLMVLAVCINPSGPLMLAYPLKTVSIGALQEYIQEWQSPNFHQLEVQPFVWLLFLTFGAVGASRKRLALVDFLLVSGFGILGFLAGRNIALFSLVAAPVLSRHAAPVLGAYQRVFGSPSLTLSRPNRTKTMLNLLILGLLVLAVFLKVSAIYPVGVNNEYFRESMPVDAVAYLKTHILPGRLFNSYNWGGYLLWALPEYPVFVDGRTDLYSNEVIDEWLSVYQGQSGWTDVFIKYSINLALIEAGSTLDRSLADRQDWREIYRDKIAVIYQRVDQ